MALVVSWQLEVSHPACSCSLVVQSIAQGGVSLSVTMEFYFPVCLSLVRNRERPGITPAPPSTRWLPFIAWPMQRYLAFVV